MEDDTTGLHTLISQRQKRPSYSRAISQEFSRKSEAVVVPRKRNRRKSEKIRSHSLIDSAVPQHSHSSGAEPETGQSTEGQFPVFDTNDGEESDESEYFSAEENSDSLEYVHQENAPSCSSSASSNDDEIPQITHQNCDNLSPVTLDTYDGNLKHRRAPSKKQKRKRRLLYSSYNLFRELPFYNDEIVNEFKDVHINKPVPTLSALCVKALVTKKKSLARHPIVPHVIRQDIGNAAAFYKEKVEWIKTYLAKFEKEKYPRFQEVLTRSVWNIEPWALNDTRAFQRNNPAADKKISCLPVTPLCGFEYHDAEFYYPSHIMIALSCLLHLTIPFPDPSKGKHRQRKLEGSAPYDRAVKNATASLHKSYPKLMGRFYDKTMPYVYWARGDVNRAKESFIQLIHTCEKSRHKALYMYEIQRMLHFFDDASQLTFDLSMSDMSDVFNEPYYSQEKVAQLICKQISLLKANLCDQGLMTVEKAHMATERWSHCMRAPPVGEGWSRDTFFLMDSLLCFHAHTYFELGIDWIQHAIEKLEPLCKASNADLYIFLSMMYAMQKQNTKCKKTFKYFESLERSYLRNVDKDKVGHCPWQTLLESVKNSVAVRPLKVLWRTQINPPRLSHERLDWPTENNPFIENCNPSEADISCRDLDLYITPEGHLTGNLQMTLPPIQSVLLNPYTGTIAQLPAVYSMTSLGSFHSVQCFMHGRYSHTFSPVIPTPMEIYRGQNGCVVSMIFPGKHQHPGPVKHLLKVFWQGPDGRRARLNLALRIRDHIYQAAKKQVRLLSMDEEMKTCMLEILRLCYLKDYLIPSTDKKEQLYETVEKAYQENKQRQLKHKDGASISLNPAKIFQEHFMKPPILNLLRPPVVFGTDIFFRFKVNEDPCRNYFVVIHTETRTEFKNPKIQERHTIDHPSYFSNGISKSAEGFYYLNTVHEPNTVCVVNRHLVMTDQVDTAILQPIKEDAHIPIVIGKSLFAISHLQYLYRINDQIESFAEHLDQIHRLTFLGDMLVMVTVSGYLLFVDSQTLLPIRVTVHSRAFALILENLYIYEVSNYLKVQGEKSFRDANNCEFVRAAILLDNKLVIIKTDPEACGVEAEDWSPITVTSAVSLSGQPKDVCFLSESAGYLVSASIFNSTGEFYRENLYHFDHSGQLLGVLLSLGRGPRSMYPVYLPGDPDLSARYNDLCGQEGWHVYMRDGHDGIICVYLGKVYNRETS